MPRKLLLADDSVTVQRVVELTFAEEGLEVVSVGDGATAVQRVSEDPPDIVLADVSMPGLDGYQVAEQVKNDPRLCHIPVVLMTGAFEPLDEVRAKAVRCDAVLAKPFEPHMVTALVHQLLDGTAVGATSGPGTGASPTASQEEAPGASLDEYLELLDEALTSSAVTAPIPTARTTAPAVAAEAVTAQAPSLADAFSALLAEELGEVPLPATWGRLAGRAPGVGPPSPVRPDSLTTEGTVPVSALSAPASAVEPILDDAAVDELARRVAERLGEAAIQDLVREVVEKRVTEVAERLVRAEIERIKAQA